MKSKARVSSTCFNNNRGMSLVEVLLAMALLGGLSVYFLQIQKNANVTKVDMENNSELVSVVNTIRKNLLSLDGCKDTLDSAGVGLGNGVSILEVKRGARVLYDIDPSPLNVSPFLELQSISVSDYATTVIPSSTLSNADFKLQIQFRKRNCGDCDWRTIRKEVDMRAKVITATNLVDKCYSAEDNAIETAIKEACEAHDLDQNNVSDNSYDTTTERCYSVSKRCMYGGSFSQPNGVVGYAGRVNVNTGAFNCPAGYTAHQVGHLSHEYAATCTSGKTSYTCYRTATSFLYNCLRCKP